MEQAAVRARVAHARRGPQRTRKWVWTLQLSGPDDPLANPRVFISDVLEPAAATTVGSVWQHERGERKQRDHLQGATIFKHPRRLAGVRRLMQRAHWEEARGTWAQIVTYCTKEDTRVAGPYYHPEDFADYKEAQGKRSDLQALVEAIQSGATDRELFELSPGSYVRYRKNLYDAVAGISATLKPRDPITVGYLWGDSGTGKSTFLFTPWLRGDLGPSQVYTQSLLNWWDNYCGQRGVLFDDLDPSNFTLEYFIKLIDRWPILVGTKGSSRWASWTVVLITSNVHYNDLIFKGEQGRGRDPAHVRALDRRFTHVVHFAKDDAGEVTTTDQRGTLVELRARYLALVPAPVEGEDEDRAQGQEEEKQP